MRRESMPNRSFSVLLFVVALVLRFMTAPRLANWYSPTFSLSDGDVFGWLSPAYMVLQALVEKNGLTDIPLFSWMCVLGAITGAACVPLLMRLAAELRFSLATQWTAGALLAVCPVLWESGSTDSPHTPALMAWLLVGICWKNGREAKARWIFSLLTASLLMVTFRPDTTHWLLIWPIMFPPKKWRSKATILELGTLFAVGILASTWVAVHHGTEMRSPDISVFRWLLFPLDILDGLSTLPLQGLATVLAVLGGIALWRTRPTFLWLLLGAIWAAALPLAFKRLAPDTILTIRYFLAPMVLVLLLVAEGIVRLFEGRSLFLKGFLLISIVFVGFLEALATFSPYNQPSFRAEQQFLAEVAETLPQDATLCMLDPKLNHRWEGPHQDLDVGFRPPPGRLPYHFPNLNVVLLNEPDLKSPGCDYYFEGGLCHLIESQTEDTVKILPLVGVRYTSNNQEESRDNSRVLAICRAVRENHQLKEIKSRWSAAKSYGAQLEADWIPLFVFDALH